MRHFHLLFKFPDGYQICARSPEQKRHFHKMLQIPEARHDSFELQMSQIARKTDRTGNPGEEIIPKRETPIHKAFHDGSCCANTFKLWTGFCRRPPRTKTALGRMAIPGMPHRIRLASCMQHARYRVVLARPSGSMSEGLRLTFILRTLVKHKMFSMVHTKPQGIPADSVAEKAKKDEKEAKASINTTMQATDRNGKTNVKARRDQT